MEIIIAVVLLIPCISPINPDIFIAKGANSKPIIATMHPIAAGGNKMSTQSVPIFLTKNAKIMKEKPKAIKPPCACA